MQRFHRRSATKVRDGEVRPKNRRTYSPDYYVTRSTELIIDRKPPGEGFRQVVTIDDVRKFLAIVPGIDELLAGVRVIVIDRGDEERQGWYRRGIVAICAWDAELVVRDWSDQFIFEHASIINYLNVPCERVDDQSVLYWTRETAKAYLLIHVLLHELGHHQDLMSNRTRAFCPRGEPYAEHFALAREAEIVDRYFRTFRI